jgi:hypothetical protein
MPKGSSSPVEMLERIRQMIARKRGPKKHLRPVYESQETVFDALEHAVAS